MTTPSRTAETDVGSDAYARFTRDFFRRWIGVYDLFAATMAPAYAAAVRAAVACQDAHRFLDVCTGTGQVAARLARATEPDASIVGVDLSDDMLAKARRRTAELDVELHLMDVRHLPFDDGGFDVAVLSMALHDMPRRVRLEVLAGVRRVTRRRLVVLDYDLPRAPWLRGAALRSMEWFETPYFKPFAVEGGDALFAEAGLEPTQRRRPWPLFGLWVFDLD